MKRIARILVVREDKLGDSCLALPVLEALRDLSPETQVTWVSQPPYASLFSGHPNVKETWTYPRKPGFVQQIQIAMRVRKLRPDAVLLLRPNNQRWQQIAWLARVKVRLGCEYSGKKGYLTENVWHPGWQALHEARKNLQMLSKGLECPVGDFPARMILEPSMQISVRKAVEALSLPSSFFVVQLGMGGSSQSFPPSFFGGVASAIYQAYGLEPVLTGTAEDAPLQEEFQAHFSGRFRSVISRTSIPELGEIVSRARFVLSVDTGTTHIAAATGTPCVVLMPKREVTPERWGPWCSPSIIVRPQEFCRRCSDAGCEPGERTCVTSTCMKEAIEACQRFID